MTIESPHALQNSPMQRSSPRLNPAPAVRRRVCGPYLPFVPSSALKVKSVPTSVLKSKSSGSTADTILVDNIEERGEKRKMDTFDDQAMIDFSIERSSYTKRLRKTCRMSITKTSSKENKRRNKSNKSEERPKPKLYSTCLADDGEEILDAPHNFDETVSYNSSHSICNSEEIGNYSEESVTSLNESIESKASKNTWKVSSETPDSSILSFDGDAECSGGKHLNSEVVTSPTQVTENTNIEDVRRKSLEIIAVKCEEEKENTVNGEVITLHNHVDEKREQESSISHQEAQAHIRDSLVAIATSSATSSIKQKVQTNSKSPSVNKSTKDFVKKDTIRSETQINGATDHEIPIVSRKSQKIDTERTACNALSNPIKPKVNTRNTSCNNEISLSKNKVNVSVENGISVFPGESRLSDKNSNIVNTTSNAVKQKMNTRSTSLNNPRTIASVYKSHLRKTRRNCYLNTDKAPSRTSGSKKQSDPLEKYNLKPFSIVLFDIFRKSDKHTLQKLKHLTPQEACNKCKSKKSLDANQKSKKLSTSQNKRLIAPLSEETSQGFKLDFFEETVAKKLSEKRKVFPNSLSFLVHKKSKPTVWKKRDAAEINCREVLNKELNVIHDSEISKDDTLHCDDSVESKEIALTCNSETEHSTLLDLNRIAVHSETLSEINTPTATVSFEKSNSSMLSSFFNSGNLEFVDLTEDAVSMIDIHQDIPLLSPNTLPPSPVATKPAPVHPRVRFKQQFGECSCNGGDCTPCQDKLKWFNPGLENVYIDTKTLMDSTLSYINDSCLTSASFLSNTDCDHSSKITDFQSTAPRRNRRLFLPASEIGNTFKVPSVIPVKTRPYRSSRLTLLPTSPLKSPRSLLSRTISSTSPLRSPFDDNIFKMEPSDFVEISDNETVTSQGTSVEEPDETPQIQVVHIPSDTEDETEIDSKSDIFVKTEDIKPDIKPFLDEINGHDGKFSELFENLPSASCDKVSKANPVLPTFVKMNEKNKTQDNKPRQRVMSVSMRQLQKLSERFKLCQLKVDVVKLNRATINKLIALCCSNNTWNESTLLTKAGLSQYDILRLRIKTTRRDLGRAKYSFRKVIKKRDIFEGVLGQPKHVRKRKREMECLKAQKKKIIQIEREKQKMEFKKRDLESIRRALLKINGKFVSQNRFWSFLDRGSSAEKPIEL